MAEGQLMGVSAYAFNRDFLLELLGFGAVSILFLFYFNRTFAFVVSLIIRAYTWHRYRAYIDFQALQISLLAGRVFFKGFRYHGRNETILVNDGFITWRYWLRRVREVDLGVQAQTRDGSVDKRSLSGGEQAMKHAAHELPCRIVLEARGLEWFIYNRSPAYDAILAQVLGKTGDVDILDPKGSTDGQAPASQALNANESPATPHFSYGKPSSSASAEDEFADKTDSSDVKTTSGGTNEKTNPQDRDQTFQLPNFLGLLPIGVQCGKGAIVMGNENTRSVLVVKFDSADGRVDARRSRPLDQYKQSFDFDFIHPTVQLKPNEEYRESQFTTGTRLEQKVENRHIKVQHTSFTSYFRHAKHEALDSLGGMIPYFKRSVLSLKIEHNNSRRHLESRFRVDGTEDQRWLGLSRYLDDNEGGQIEQERWKIAEYARSIDIIDSPQISMSFFWDIPGLVPPISENRRTPRPEYGNDINRDRPPDWGIELKIKGGHVTYGPWADRQRADLQSFFFPPLYADAIITEPLKPGQNRISTSFKLFIELEDHVTLRIPTKEESKDWRWKGHPTTESDLSKKNRTKNRTSNGRKSEKTTLNPEIRSPGWLDLAVSGDSSITYTIDMVASESGFQNKLHIDLKTPEMFTSVNNGLLWRAKSQSISCNLSNPLKWNILRNWLFDIYSTELELFILRDHVFLLTDLLNDWTTGPPGEFYTFVPFRYALTLQLPEVKIYLNVNDSNIINNPSSTIDNTFIVIWANQMRIDLSAPIEEYRPLKNQVIFDVDASHGGFQLITPTWNTQRTLLDTPEIASLEELIIKGSYNFCTSTSPNLTDTVLLDLNGHSPKIHLYGFLVRYFMILKDNYFGDDLHFQTLDEYQQKINQSSKLGMVRQDESSQSKLSNDLDVILTVSADDACLTLPSNLYAVKENVKIDISSITLDLRFTNYYMDLEASFSTLALSRAILGVLQNSTSVGSPGTQAFVDGITVSGHRLFGLPPAEPTYVCNWDFDIGSITGETSTQFLCSLVSAGRCFAFSFTDAENALPPYNPIVLHDVTFLRAKIASIRVWVHVEQSAVLLSTGTIKVDFNDWTTQRFSDRLHLIIPKIVLGCVDGRIASYHRTRLQLDVVTYAYLETSVDVRMLERKPMFDRDKQLQQEHLSLHDTRTRRASWLLHSVEKGVIDMPHQQKPKIRLATMPYPLMPEPANVQESMSDYRQQQQSASFKPFYSKQSASRQSSFLSLSSLRRRSDRQSKGDRLDSVSPDTLSGKSSKKQPDLIISSSRQSSFQVNSDLAKRTVNGLPPTSVAFTSSYETPYFPMYMIEPNTRDVPFFPNPGEPTETSIWDVQSDDGLLEPESDTSAHTTFMIHFRFGMRGLCTPKAIQSIGQLIEALRPKDPISMLDDIQLKAMGEVISSQKSLPSLRRLQIQIRLPRAAVRFRSQDPLEEIEQTEHQSYDLSLSQLAVTARRGPEDVKSPEAATTTRSALHVSLQQVSAAVKGGKDTYGYGRDQARIDICLNDITSWLAKDNGLTGELQLRDLRVVSLNRQVGHLVSLLSNTLNLVEHDLSQFQDAAKAQVSRLHFLIYSLATSSTCTGLADPSFLTSASFILRNASNHPRISDTWKLLMRLRFIYQSLPEGNQQLLAEQCLLEPPVFPSDAKDQVIESFNRWRSWDLESITASKLLQRVYGPLEESEDSASSSLQLVQLRLKCGTIQCLIDPGPEQNEVEVERLAVTIASIVPRVSSIDKSNALVETTRHTTIEVFCMKGKIHLNWAICELLEGILHEADKSTANNSSKPNTPLNKPTPSNAHVVHLLVVMENGDLSLRSVNLKASSLSQGLTASLIASIEDQSTLITTVVSADNIASTLSSQSKVLVDSNLQDSTLKMSLDKAQHQVQSVNTWNFGALCQDLDIGVREDFLGILGLVDIVIRDEISYVFKLMSISGTDQIRSPDTVSSETRQWTNKVHVALLLNTYSIAVALLPSLEYSMRGTGARSSLRPVTGADDNFEADFDIKAHTHTFVNHTNGAAREISSLPLPSINGRLLLKRLDSRISIAIFFAMEKIILDLSAVHGLLTTSSKAEMLSFRRSITADMDIIQLRWSDVVGTNEALHVQKASSNDHISFNAHFSTAGLSMKAASGEKGDKQSQLRFEIGNIYVNITNEDAESKELLFFPEISAGFQSFKVLLERLERSEIFPCGDIDLGISFRGTTKKDHTGEPVRSFEIKSTSLEINLFAHTASTMVTILGHLQQSFATLDLSEVRSLRARRRVRLKSQMTVMEPKEDGEVPDELSESLFTSMYSLEMNNVEVSWKVGDLASRSPGHEIEDLVLSISKIDLATRKENAARLIIENLQLQMVPSSQSRKIRSYNSALLPEVVFNVAYISTSKDRRLAFQATGKSLDLRVTSQFIIPASNLQRSIGLASQELRKVLADWNASSPQTEEAQKSILSNKKLSSLLVDADFGGAVVYVQGKSVSDPQSVALNVLRGGRVLQHGRYGQFTQQDASSNTTLRAPGIAVKVEYQNLGNNDPSLNAEVKVSASTNIIYPTIVPLILELSASIRDIVGDPVESQELKSPTASFLGDDKLAAADPVAILGNSRLNLGLRICRQEFSLSCQPIARVAATAQFENIYVTLNTVQSTDQARFFAMSAIFTRLQASVQHVYSRESTGSFDIESINLSLMNSKHISTARGISAILRVSPAKVFINTKQLHDFLLFREIWVPFEVRHSQSQSTSMPVSESHLFGVQRYKQVATASTFPWDTTISISKLDVQLDLGQSIGRSAFSVSNLWLSSKKNSDWEQNLCLGFDQVGVDCTGRMSGFIELHNLRVRTSIWWPAREMAKDETPLIQASLSFGNLRLKASFDFQPFLIANILSLEFLMYNVRDADRRGGDRLVGFVNAETVQVFCTTTSSSQALALYQAVQRLIQEKQSAFENSLRDIEKFLRRKSSIVPSAIRAVVKASEKNDKEVDKTPVQLHTNVVVSLKAVNVGAFPSSFFDNQIFKLEALDASARFTVVLEEGKIRSNLGLTLGQVRIALSGVTRTSAPKTLGDVPIEEVIASATGSRGGTILKVPKVDATMKTWQKPESMQIDFVFKSSFEGKVEVGWNYSRISFIRGMWANHSRTLAQRLGKPLPPSALQITGGPQPDGNRIESKPPSAEQEKITAVVHVPQSKYEYRALEPPIIETPQLRDMGEATPPLEWIGLHRERLPNLVHQIVIVTLLEVAKEVEDAYSKILGSS